MNQTLGTTTISWKPTLEPRKKPMTAVMQLINFILVERRQDDGSIKFHAHEDFSRFLKMEKEQIMDAYWNGTIDMEKQDALSEAEKFYNEYYKN